MKTLDAIIYAKDWVELDPIACDEVPGYNALIARIENEDTRRRAYQALREGDRGRLENLLAEND